MYVQKLFSRNKGTHVLHSTLNDNSISFHTLNDSSVYQVVSTDETNAIIVKIVNTNETPKDIYIQLKDIQLSASTAEISFITTESLNDINTVAEPDKISIEEKIIELDYKDSNSFVYQVPKYSVVVIRIPRKNK